MMSKYTDLKQIPLTYKSIIIHRTPYDLTW